VFLAGESVSKKNRVPESSEEGLLEQAFRLESIYNKHKMKLWVLLVLIVLLLIAKLIWNGIEQKKLEKANDAYLLLQEESNNSVALSELKSNNPKLYELYLYSEAMENQDSVALKELASSNNEILADLSSYAVSVLEKDPRDSKIFGDLAKIQNAYLHMQNKEFDRAKEILELIPEESSLYEYALRLKHITLKGE
jgi:hypothetical protein